LLASVGFVSYLPYKVVPFAKWKGGGLLGSIAGLALFWVSPAGGAAAWLCLAAVVLLSIPVCHYAEKFLGHHDDPRIVIDEVAGVWVAAAFLPREPVPMLAALVLFRFFDVWKGPWGRWAQRLPGGWGVIMDDLLAGLVSNLIARLFLA
jgi:phosphatidylglycerophosphatase A